jgi:hypothetical protein
VYRGKFAPVEHGHPPERLLRSVDTRGSRFLNYNFLQFAVDGKNNSKTKVEKVFFFIFMSFYAEMSFLKQKITK